MSNNVRAGVAYVDVRLGSIEQFKNKLKSEVESAAVTAGKDAGNKLAKSFSNTAKAGFQDFSRDMTRLNGTIWQKLATQASASWSSGVSRIKTSVSSIPGLFARMATGVGSAISGIPTKLASASTAISNFSRVVGFASFQVQNFGIIATAGFTAPVAAALAFGTVIGVKTAAQIEQATAALKFLVPAGYDVDALLKRLEKTAQQSPIFDTADLIQYTQRFVAAGVEIGKTERFLKAFSNVALVTGTDTQRAGLAILAIAQAFGKGKLQAEELNQQLGEAMPAAMKIIRESLGVTQAEFMEMVKEGKVTGDDLINIFTNVGESGKFLQGAAAGAETLSGKWQAFKEGLQTQLGNIFLKNSSAIKQAIDELGPSVTKLVDQAGPAFVGLIKGFGKFVDIIAKLVDWYSKLSPGQKDFVNTLLLISILVGPLVLVIGAFMGAVAGIAAGFALLITPVALVTAGIVLAIGAIVGIIFWLKDLYNEGGKFKERWDAIWASFMELIKPIVDEFKNQLTGVKQAFQRVVDSFKKNKEAFDAVWQTIKIVGIAIGVVIAAVAAAIFGVLKGLVSAIGPIFNAIASIISGVIKFIMGIISFFIHLFTGEWDKLGKDLRMIWDGLWDLVIGTLLNVIQAIMNFVEGLVTGIVDFFKWLWNVLVGHSIIPDLVNAIFGWFRKLVDSGVNILRGIGEFFLNFYRKYGQPFIDALINGFNSMVSWLSSLASKITSVFSGAWDWLYNAGKNVVEGLINGVKSMAGTLKRAILDLIPSSVRGIVADALGIHSPSRVFMEMGESVVLGFIKGIRSMTPVLRNEMQSLAGIMPRTIAPEFGSPSDPLLSPPAIKAALNIENYHAKEDDDPRKQSEDWYFLVTARGGVV